MAAGADREESGPYTLQVRLDVVAGPNRGQTFTFDGHQTFLVGRSQRAHLRLAGGDPYFSRIHFMVEINPPCCRVYDMGSTNGTRVNGNRVQSADLHHGDVVEAGDTVLQVSFLGDWGARAGRTPPAGVHAQAGSTVTDLDPDATESFHAHGTKRPARAPHPPAREGPSVPGGEMPIVPGYDLVREIGRGGMGVVHLALRRRDLAEVAVKVICPAVTTFSIETKRFLREAAILQQLQHPNIVSFHESGQAGDLLFFVMDYVRGTNAEEILKQEPFFAIPRAVDLMSQALEGLQYAHQKGFVHRDVKPANLLVEQTATGEVCKLADFGIARAYQASSLSGLTMMGDIGGTIPYMPPEQITDYRTANPPADQYAAAATLYRLLTGSYVFDFENLRNHQRLSRILFEEPVPVRSRRPEIPEALAQAIHRALAKDPDGRFKDAGAFRGAILRGAR